MHPVTLCVTLGQVLGLAAAGRTRSVSGGIPMQSVGTIMPLDTRGFGFFLREICLGTQDA
ncbi:hypothetical protein TU73_23120 [Pseudomonas libanensis]|uniref:Uncharacterized protein n=1 Tax=Pseudomonas libanensis TaxID=75588 RepID=A0A0R2Y5M7_9PSED|nr:hypothetical protein TU73_23120 [Pseudomonas libanensis]